MKKKEGLIFKCLLLCLLFFTFFHAVAEKQAMTPESLYEIIKVSDPRVSPDGEWIAYTQSVPRLKENKYISDIWIIPVGGGHARQLTRSSGNNFSPRWSPTAKEIAFISTRNKTANVFILPLDGGEARQLTHSETGLYSPKWSANGRYILCQSRVMPEDKKNIENRTKDQLPLCKARTIDGLLFRQWDRWLGDKRNHLLLVDYKDGEITDLTPGDRDVPPVSLAGDDFDISPNGKEICFSRNDDPMLAISTNHDLFLLDIATKTETKLTTNPALDGQPAYSPDGRYIAYGAMKKAGYESDWERIILYDRKYKTHKTLTGKLKESVEQILWAHNSKHIYFTCRVKGLSPIYQVDLTGKVVQLTNEGYNTALDITPGGNRLVYLRTYNHFPKEVFSMKLDKKKTTMQLTAVNKEFLAKYELPKLEGFRFKGADGDWVHGYIQRPPGFDAHKKYPVVLTIHGGPQNMWSDRFMSSWWTFPLISSPGYVGVFLNPRGSTGYGPKFREQVSRDYGGRAFIDMMKGMDHVIAHYKFVDKTRQAAVGGSYGGYSVNWMMGRTERFKCYVSHAGLYNLLSFYGATEELWYPEWDMGKSPWDEPEIYNKWSPHLHAKKFKTPTLVTHGQLDFRVPFAESLQLFTALKRQGIDSRLLVFPDEGHVISNPQNNVRWWKEMHEWLSFYLK